MSKIDKDNPEWTAEMFRKSKPASELPQAVLDAFPNTRGAQKAPKKEAISIRLSPEVLDHFRSSGPGWQGRIDETLKRHVEKA